MPFLLRTLIPVVALAAAAGCASTSPEPAFRNAARLVSAQSGQRIAWNQGGDDDAAVARSLRALLAQELTVDAAVEVALLGNKSLQATYEELSLAQADLVQAGLLRNPVFGAGIVFPVAGRAQTGGVVSVSEDFLGVLTLAARKKIARAEVEAATLRVADAVLGLAYDVESAFYALQAAQQVAAMRRTILEAGDAALELAQRQHDAGNISELDLATQQTLYEQVRTDSVRSQAEVVTAREKLARLLGVWGDDASFRVAEKLPELPEREPPLDHLEALAVGRRLDLRAAGQAAEAIEHALAMARDFRFLDGLALGGSFERAPEGFSVAGPNASLELPIFDQKHAVVARLDAKRRAARARQQALAVEVRSEVRAATERLKVSRELVERYAKVVVPLRERVVALSQEQYSAMLVGAYPVLLAKQGEVNAYRELIEALRDYWVARAEVERATGGSLEPPHEAPTRKVQP